VLFVVAGLDIRQDNYVRLWEEVLKNKLPWTITLASEMPHAFDAFSETDGSKRLIMTTISYWLNQLGKVPPSTTPPSAERAIVAARYEDTEKMLQLMREWIAQHPDTRDAYALSAYANALVDTKNFAEAEKYLKKSIDVNPSNKGNYLNMVVVCYALGKPKEASANLLLYEKNSTPEGFTYGYIANRLIETNQFKEAAENYERAISFPNPHSFIYYNLGCCYAMLGDKERAFVNLNKAVDLKFGDKTGYEVDENLKNLHGDARWIELMARMSK
jgi:tetratricopeptide (TPR) repeat protein